MGDVHFLCLGKENEPKERRYRYAAATQFPALLAKSSACGNSLRSNNRRLYLDFPALLGRIEGRATMCL